MFTPLKPKLDSLRIILATTSVQRHNVLKCTGLNFETMASDFEENLDRELYTFSEFVEETAKGKVDSIHERTKNDDRTADIIIGMDTMVLHDCKLYGKPKNKEEAALTIRTLANSGIPHEVYTGVVIKYKNRHEKFTEITKVHMHHLTDEEITGYVETGEPMGKAGAYAIQGIGGSFVTKIEGDYYNIIDFQAIESNLPGPHMTPPQCFEDVQ